MNFVTVIREETAHVPEGHVAIEQDGATLTYAELFEQVDATAAVLQQRGILACDRVALSCPDNKEYVILSLSILSIGGVVIPAPVASAPEVVEELLEKTAAGYLIRARPPFSECTTISVGGTPFHLSARSADRMPDEFYGMNPAFIRFSSGTTGASKGVLLSHEAIEERTRVADTALRITSDDKVLWLLSMSFHFVVTILLFLRRGATISLCSELFPYSFLSAVERGGGTFLYGTPFHYRSLVDLVAADSLCGVRMAVSTAMKLKEETARDFEQKFDFTLHEAYGLIEAGLPFVEPCSAGTLGRPLPGFELRVEQPDEMGCGEICLRGPGMYAAYLAPWTVREKAEWFNTGDVGFVDDEGRLSLVGRLKNVINFAGMKIFPYEVEAVLEQHDAVEDALVFAETHDRYGEMPVARVAGATCSADELQRFCYEHLDSYKVPKKFEFVDELERTSSGKVCRAEVLKGA